MNKDKSSLEFHGKKQSAYCFQLLDRFCGRVFISNRQDQAELPGQAGFPQIHDKEDFAGIGPLGGILSAMTVFPDVSWLVLACDLPYVNERIIQELIAKRNLKKTATAFLSAHDHLPEPLCAIYEANTKDYFLGFLKKGIDCPRKILIHSDVELLKQPDMNALENINTPQEFEKAARILQKGKMIHIRYYAFLREKRGMAEEKLITQAETALDLYEELQKKYMFPLSASFLKVAVNSEFADWSVKLNNQDEITFIPPVAGG